jgi:hypothetical protein
MGSRRGRPKMVDPLLLSRFFHTSFLTPTDAFLVEEIFTFILYGSFLVSTFLFDGHFRSELLAHHY